MKIYKMNNEELGVYLEFLKKQLDILCSSADYIWYLQYKDCRKDNFENYSDYRKCLRKRTRISKRLSYLRATIQGVENELHIRNTQSVVLKKIKRDKI